MSLLVREEEFGDLNLEIWIFREVNPGWILKGARFVLIKNVTKRVKSLFCDKKSKQKINK